MSDYLAVGVPVVFHVIMASMYGGELLDTEFPDAWAYVSTGLFLVGQENALPLPQIPIVLPLFCGILYVILGFPDFLFYLWVWNAITLSVLIVSVYKITLLLYNRRSARLAALLVGLNWRIGTNGQQFLVDVPLVAFSLSCLYLILLYNDHDDVVVAFLSGVVFSIAFWTKFSFIYLFSPILLWVLVRELGQKREGCLYFVTGLILSQAFFFGIRWYRYGDPLLGIGAEAEKHVHLFFSPLYWDHLPEYLGYPALIFSVLGLLLSLKERRYLIPFWAVYGIAVYTFMITPPRYFQYSVHFLPAFLILSAFGLTKTLDVISSLTRGFPRRFLRIVLPSVTVLLTDFHFKETSKTVYIKIMNHTIFRTRYVTRFLYQKLEIESRFIRYPQRYLSLRGSVTPDMIRKAPYSINCSYSILLVQDSAPIIWRILLLIVILGLLLILYKTRSRFSRLSTTISQIENTLYGNR